MSVRVLRQVVGVCVALAGGAGGMLAQSVEPVMIKGRAAHPTRLLARVRPDAQVATQAFALAVHDLQIAQQSSLVPGLVVLDADGQSRAMAAAGAAGTAAALRAEQLQARLEALRASGLFEYVEPDYVITLDATPNDSAFVNGSLWGLRNTGQNGGTPGVDIDAVRAWDITKGSTNVIVAVLDSGIHSTHLDLATQMWRNPGETAGNGIDDDGNGYIDDVFGIDAVNHTGNITDSDGHGTHVAGTIGAAANNGQPHVGVAWNVRLMACKIFTNSSEGFISAAIAGLDYAADHGATIVNCSWGIASRSQALGDAVRAVGGRGVLVVTAAGNDNSNNDLSPHYPSNYEYDNVVAVAAIDRYGSRASFSNFGAQSVDLGAPGAHIDSTAHNSNTAYQTASGTSMATPHVVGVAALVRAAFPGISVGNLRDRLLRTTVAMTALQGITSTNGRVNAYQALTHAGDGQLELTVMPLAGIALFHGRELALHARVTDLVGVVGATVTATMSSGGTAILHDDGVAPDLTAGDANYAALVSIPMSGTQWSVTVNASASGKSAVMVSRNFTLQAPPANDRFAARTPITFHNGTMAANNLGATIEPGEPAIAGEVGGASLWWTWTAPATTSVTLDTVGSSFDTLLGVYTGGSVDALTEIASNDDIDGPNQPSKVVFNATAGMVYQIAVDGWEGKTGSITLNLATTIPPVNDDFANRLTVTGNGFATTGSNLHATREAGEPVPPGAPGEHSVWWSWTSPSSGPAIVTSQAASFSTDVAVYLGDDRANLVRVPGRLQEENGGIFGRITFYAHAGTTYQFAVTSRFAGQMGNVGLNLARVQGLPNDLFDQATVITGENATASGSLAHATREIDEPSHSPSAVGASGWWRWTAPYSGRLDITLDNVYDVVVTAYTGSSLGDLVLQDSSRDQGGARLRISVAGGETYSFAADWQSAYATPGTVMLTFALTPSPTNDRFGSRIPLTGNVVQTTGTNLGATSERGEPSLNGWSAPGASVWWSWTAPATGTAVFHVDGQNPRIGVFTGSSVSGLTLVPGSTLRETSHRTVRTYVQAGASYEIAVDGGWGTEGPFTLAFEFHAAPPNDFFADRIALGGESVMITGTNQWATSDIGEAQHGQYPMMVASVWWTWTAPANGTVLITDIAAGFQVNVTIYTGDSVTSLTKVTDNRLFSYAFANHLAFSAQQGTAYHIAVSSEGLQDGAVSMQLALVDPPANDNFAQRSVLTGENVSLTTSNVGATAEAADPGQNNPGGDSSIWWTWTAPRAGTAVFSTQGSSIANTLAVYTGSSLGELTAIQSIIDVNGENEVVFPTAAGVTYQIRVAGYQGATGNLALRVSLIEPPANDAFAQATALTGTAVLTTGTTVGATMEPGESGSFPGGSSIWWKWAAPATGAVIVSLAGSEIPTRLILYRGSSLSSLEPITGDQWYEGMPSRPEASAHVTGGTAYYIAGYGLSSARGTVVLRVTYLPPPGNDAFANRVAITGLSATIAATNLGASAELGEPSMGYWPAPRGSVWWTWTAPESGTVSLFIPNGPPFLIGVYTGSSLGGLVAQPNSNPWVGTANFVFHADAGTTYQVEVASGFGTTQGGPFTLEFEHFDAPPNDLFADRILLSGEHVSATTTHEHATIEIGEPMLQSQFETATLWWTWTAPVSDLAVIRTTSEIASNSVVRVFTGDSLATLQAVPFAPSTGSALANQAIIDAVAGTTYQIGVGMRSDFEHLEQTLLIDIVDDPPSHDAFATRSLIEGSDVTIHGSNLGATFEDNEPVVGSSAAGNSVWWRWTAPRSGKAVVDVRDCDFLASVAVFTGDSLATLTPVTYANRTQAGSPRVLFDAIEGTTYQIGVYGYLGGVGNIVLEVGVHEPPPNDRFADRSILTGASAVATGTNLWAGVEANEPGAGFIDPSATVWWTWTAPVTGVVAFDTKGSDFDSTIGVFTGEIVETLQELVPTRSLSGWQGAPAFATYEVTAGTVLQICVDSSGMEQGNVVLHAGVFQPPANDNFAQRLTLFGLEPAVTGSNLGASYELNDPRFEYAWSNQSVWWTWTAPASGPYVVSTAGSDFDTLLGVLTGTELTALERVVMNDDVSWNGSDTSSLVVLQATAGQSYEIFVDGKNQSMGDIALAITWVGPENPTVAMASGPITIDAPLTLTASVEGAGPYTYQWLFAGDIIPGATTNTLEIPSVQAFHHRAYSVRIANSSGFVTTNPVELNLATPSSANGRLLNLSTRAMSLTGDNVLIPGFVIAGTTSKQLLIRAVGPTLGTFGVPGVLPNPRMTLKRWNGTTHEDVALNDNWGTNTNVSEIVSQSAAVSAFPLTAGSADAALLVDLPPGQYSVVAGDAGGDTGIAIVELYDADAEGGSARLINISNRGYVGVADSIMIPGFVVSNEGPKTLLIRAVGPTLAQFGVSGVLSNPTLTIYRRNQSTQTDEVILANDDWGIGPGAQRTRDVAAEVQAFALPEGSRDAAFVVTLNPGIYTVHARGANNATGVALVEIYVVP